MTLRSTDYALLAQSSYADPEIERRSSDNVQYKTIKLDGVEYRPIDFKDNPRNGFQAAAYEHINNDGSHDVVIAYRGTEFNREPLHDGVVDAGMALAGVNAQTADATSFTRHVLERVNSDAARNHYPVNVTVTGHSLGGTLAEIEAHKFGLHGETFNAYGAAGLMQDVPKGGNQVIDHVRATDVVSAASSHFGEVRVYATEQDIAAIRGAGYTNTPFLNELPTHAPVLGKIQGNAHAVANFAPSPAHPSIISAEDARNYSANKVAIDAYRSDIQHAATVASLPGKAVTGVAETTIATQEKLLQAELYAGHKAAQAAEYVGHKTAQGAEYVEHKAAQGAQYVADKTMQGAHYAEVKAVQGAQYAADKTVQAGHYAGEKAAQGVHAVSRGVQQIEQSAAKGYDTLTHPGAWFDSKSSAPTTVQPARPNDPRNPDHPQHAKYEKLHGLVADAYGKHGMSLPPEQLERVTAQVMLDAQRRPMKDIHEVRLNPDNGSQRVHANSNVMAFSGDPHAVTTLRCCTDVQQARQTPPEHNFQQLDQLQQKQAQVTLQQTQTPLTHGPGGGPSGR